MDKWISVEDRLPLHSCRALGYQKIKTDDWVSPLSDICIVHYYESLGAFDKISITHWMPLPDPPVNDDGQG